jgi:hypothetical protein
MLGIYVLICNLHQKNASILLRTGDVWDINLEYRYGTYGLWDSTELWVIPANQVGGCQIPWVFTGYG